MSFAKMVQVGISSLIQLPVIKELAGPATERVVEIFEQHFILGSDDISEAFQESYKFSMAAIAAGLKLEAQKNATGLLSFFANAAKLGEQNISREFSNQLKELYLVPFAGSEGLSENDLRVFCKEGAGICKSLSKKAKESLPVQAFPDFEIVSLLNTNDTPDISYLLVNRIERIEPHIDKRFIRFFCFEELLGNALLHFFRENLRRNERVATTINALRQEGLWADVKNIQSSVEDLKQSLEVQLNQFEQSLNEKEKQIREAAIEERKFLRQERRKIELLLDSVEEKLSGNLEETLRNAQHSWAEFGGRIDLFEEKMGELCSVVSSRFDAVIKTLEDELKPIKVGIEEAQKKLDRILTLLTSDRKLSPDAIAELASGLDAQFSLKDRFEFDRFRPIGQGAVGFVYEARNKGTEEVRALKLLNSVAAQDEKIVTRFLREAMVMYQLKSCNNIVRIFSSGGGNDLEFFIEMEFIAGGTLRSLIEERPSFPTILDTGLQLCRALEVCHSAGIVHRDVNPNNVMFTKDGTLKLMDFGVAKIIGLEGLTQQGQQVGTGNYMAPEQREGLSHLADRRSDVYSVGSVLYHLSARRRPPHDRKPEAIRSKNPSIPKWFDELILQCLALKPDDRPSDAKELRERLENEGWTSDDFAFRDAVSETVSDNHGILSETNKRNLLRTARRWGVSSERAESIITEVTQSAHDPIVLFREQVKEELNQQEALTEESKWDLLNIGVKMGLGALSIRQIFDEFDKPKEPETKGSRVTSPSLSDTIRDFVFENYIKPAQENGEGQLTIRAGDIHKEMGLSGRYPAVNSVLRGKKLQEQFNVSLLRHEGQKEGGNSYYTFELVLESQPSFEVLCQHFFETLKTELSNSLDNEWEINNELQANQLKLHNGFELTHSVWRHKCRIRIEPQRKELSKIIIGIARRTKGDDFIDYKVFAPLRKGRRSPWWVWYFYVDERYQSLSTDENKQHLRELYAGNTENELLEYYLDELLRLKEFANPILQKAVFPEELEKRRQALEKRKHLEDLFAQVNHQFEDQLPPGYVVNGSRSKNYRIYHRESEHHALHYEFLIHYNEGIGVEIHIEQKQFADRIPFLKSLVQRLSDDSDFDVSYDPEWSYGGRLIWFHPSDTPAETIAENMHQLIHMSQGGLWPEEGTSGTAESGELIKHTFDNDEVKLILCFRQYPQRHHLEKHLDLIRELILFTGLEDSDRRIALTIPGYGGLPVNINNRYVLKLVGDRNTFGMLVSPDYAQEVLGVDLASLQTKEDRQQALKQSIVAKERGVIHLSPFSRIGSEDIEQIPYWCRLTNTLLDQESLEPRLLDTWRTAVLYEMNRAAGSPYRKFHQSVVYKAALELEYRKTLLDAAYSNEEFKLKPVQWNGVDFYVSFGVGEHRQWEDAQRYGFVSGGQGEWYSRTFRALEPGTRVYVRIPKKGYVGIGEVEATSVPIKEFMVEIDGVQKNILEAPLLAPKMDENADDLSKCEYLVRVKWIKTVSVKDAVWESDMFFNRNTVCKLTDEMTVEKLVTAFGIEAIEGPTILVQGGNQMTWEQGGHAGEIRELPEIPGARLVWIPPGRFEAGQATEVVLTNGFWLWQTPVTQRQFEAVMGYNPSHFSGDGSLPVECVSWHEATAFCNRVSHLLGLPELFSCQGEVEDTRCELKSEYSGNEGKDYYLSPGFRLPTKTELYYSCRAGVNAPLYGEMNEISWYKHNSENKTHPVAQKQPNSWNLYDLLGNVYVWCWDRWYNKLDVFSEGYVENPVYLKGGSWRMLHGSSWNTADRYTSNESGGRDSAHNRKNWIGFRPAITGG